MGRNDAHPQEAGKAVGRLTKEMGQVDGRRLGRASPEESDFTRQRAAKELIQIKWPRNPTLISSVKATVAMQSQALFSAHLVLISPQHENKQAPCLYFVLCGRLSEETSSLPKTLVYPPKLKIPMDKNI